MQERALTQTARLERMFANQVRDTPEAPAIVYRDEVVTYAELEALVEGLSRELISHGVGPGVLVALDLQRKPATIAALLAILTAGGAYLPLDPRSPPERIRFVLADSRASVLLTDGASSAAGGFGGTILELSNGELIQRSYGGTPTASGPGDLAYAIYTSGSTGAPKGVMLGHGATHLVDWAKGFYSADARSRVAATTSFAFDPSIFEIFVPLCTGGALVLKESGLQPFTADDRPTLLDSVPSVLAELCRSNTIPGSILALNVGGEVLSGELAREVHQGRPGLKLYNHYGPTEATTCATVAEVAPDLAADPSIGRPVRGATITLLGASGDVCADGETGEIAISGPGLALGYLNRPDRTAARFRDGPGGRVYRTGDLGVWRDGDLHFAGRLDRQVKIRGFRVELGEVEAALMRIPEVQNAVAMTRSVSGRSHIIAYVQPREPLTSAGVREAVRARVPDYMVP